LALATPRQAQAQTITFDSIAYSFVGTPYLPHTLDRDTTERVVVCLSGVDCNTLVDYVTASLCFDELPDSLNADYYRAVRQVRYRDGHVSYASRHHYFSDWIASNASAGRIDEVTPLLGGIPAVRPIDYMTTHADLYPQLAANRPLQDSIRQRERELSATPYYYIPKERVADISDLLQHGDLIAVTTSTPGLDIQHVGFIWRSADGPHLLHASTDGNRVVVSPNLLADYLARISRATGIRVMRLREAPAPHR
jgi:cell wall-associated NlpC family hydrolase